MPLYKLRVREYIVVEKDYIIDANTFSQAVDAAERGEFIRCEDVPNTVQALDRIDVMTRAHPIILPPENPTIVAHETSNDPPF